MDEKTLRKIVREELIDLNELRVWSYAGRLQRPGVGWTDVFGHVTAKNISSARNLVREREGVRRLSRKIMLQDMGPSRDHEASAPKLSDIE